MLFDTIFLYKNNQRISTLQLSFGFLISYSVVFQTTYYILTPHAASLRQLKALEEQGVSTIVRTSQFFLCELPFNSH